MTDAEIPFLRAVLAAPDDPLPRLIMADWWDENGQPERAEFARVQCRIADLQRLGCHDWQSCNVTDQCAECNREAEVAGLRHRELELLATDGPPIHGGRTWNGVTQAYRWMPRAVIDCDWCEFRRGFVESITCTAADWLRHAEAIRAATPLRKVVLTDLPRVTFRADDWSGLGDRPKRFYPPPPADYSVRVSGISRYLLAAEFPGIEFELLNFNPHRLRALSPIGYHGYDG